jgi:hypothetical protein
MVLTSPLTGIARLCAATGIALLPRARRLLMPAIEERW